MCYIITAHLHECMYVYSVLIFNTTKPLVCSILVLPVPSVPLYDIFTRAKCSDVLVCS